MANGPPTPPPTTDVEIQDAARDPPEPPVVPPNSNTETTTTTAQPVPPPQPSQPAQSQDVIQQIFASTIAVIAVAKEWQQLIHHAEYDEISVDDAPTKMMIVAPLVLAYLIQDELPAAKFALMRLPPRLQRLPLSTALVRLLQATTDRHHGDVYARAAEIPLDGDLGGTVYPEFAAILGGMVDAFYESFRIRTFILLSKAYSEISLPLAQHYLGLQAETLLKAAESYGWKYDAQTQVLSPIAPISSATPFSGVSSLQSFDFVSNSVSKLEM